MRIRSRLSLAFASVASLSILAVATAFVFSNKRLIESERLGRYEQVSRQLARAAEESLLQGPIFFLNYTRALQDEEGFVSAYVTMSNGEVRLHSDPNQPLPSQDGSHLIFSHPVSLYDEKVGTAHLVLNRHAIERRLKEERLQNVRRTALMTLPILLGAIVVAIAIAGALTRPLQAVVTGMKSLSSGRLEPIPFAPRQDELGWMADEINLTIAKLKDLDEMKRLFVNGVTHDFKNPLVAIENGINLIASRLPVEIQQDRVVANSLLSVHNNVDQLQIFVRQLLEIARIEKGQVPLIKERVNIPELLERIRLLFAPSAEAKGLALTVRTEPGLTCLCDSEKIQQVVSNLVANAIKLTSEGSVVLRAARDGAWHVLLSVTDTGPGLPVADRQRIFELFYQAKHNVGATVRKADGVGLGLAVAKGWVSSHGGTIWVESPGPGKGATFHVRLPMDASKTA